jgi:hypothetical protein
LFLKKVKKRKNSKTIHDTLNFVLKNTQKNQINGICSPYLKNNLKRFFKITNSIKIVNQNSFHPLYCFDLGLPKNRNWASIDKKKSEQVQIEERDRNYNLNNKLNFLENSYVYQRKLVFKNSIKKNESLIFLTKKFKKSSGHSKKNLVSKKGQKTNFFMKTKKTYKILKYKNLNNFKRSNPSKRQVKIISELNWNSNLMLQKGWVYHSSSPLLFLNTQNSVKQSGNLMGNEVIFDSHSINVESLSITQKNLVSSKIASINLKDVNFKAYYKIQKTQSRFEPFLLNQKTSILDFPTSFYKKNPFKIKGENDLFNNDRSKLFLLFQVGKEFYQPNLEDYKKEIYELSNRTKLSSSLVNFDNLKSSFLDVKFNFRNYKGIPVQNQSAFPIFLNKMSQFFQLYESYQTEFFNKEKLTPDVLSKYPSTELNLITNQDLTSLIQSFYSISDETDLIENPISEIMLNTDDTNELIPPFDVDFVSVNKNKTPLNLLLNKIVDINIYPFKLTTLKSVNLSPLLIQVKSPYSFKFPFKTGASRFCETFDLNKLLFSHSKVFIDNTSQINQSTSKTFTKFESSRRYFKSILFFYFLNLKNQWNISNSKKTTKIIEKTLIQSILFNKQLVFNSRFFNRFNENLKLNEENTLKNLTFISNFSALFSSFFSCPLIEHSLNQNFEKSVFYPDSVFPNQNKSPLPSNLNNSFNRQYLAKFKPGLLGLIHPAIQMKTTYEINKEGLLYDTKLYSFNNQRIRPSSPFLKTYQYSPCEGEFVNQLPLNLIKGFQKRALILSKKDQISFSYSCSNYKETYSSLEKLKKINQYYINDTSIQFLDIIFKSNENVVKNHSKLFITNPIEFDLNLDFSDTNSLNNKNIFKLIKTDSSEFSQSNRLIAKISNLPVGKAEQINKLLVGNFLVYGDQINVDLALEKSGQIIHLNDNKITLRKGQPIFISPNASIYKQNGDYIEKQTPVLTLSYQQLKTGDIIQGIPKVEQFFEARTTKQGRLFNDSIVNLLKAIFLNYCSKFPFDIATRHSIYKIQQIIIDGVHRVYRSQGVSITDKHLEVIVKQMTAKVCVTEGRQSGYYPGDLIDIDHVEYLNTFYLFPILYEPLVFGITKASLEVDSFLSACSFQQTSKILTRSALYKKRDFLFGLKENAMIGNLIPAGTGYMVYTKRYLSINTEKILSSFLR